MSTAFYRTKRILQVIEQFFGRSVEFSVASVIKKLSENRVLGILAAIVVYNTFLD